MFSFKWWLSLKLKICLQRIVKMQQNHWNIIKRPSRPPSILADPSHPQWSKFVLLSSEHKYIMPNFYRILHLLCCIFAYSLVSVCDWYKTAGCKPDKLDNTDTLNLKSLFHLVLLRAFYYPILYFNIILHLTMKLNHESSHFTDLHELDHLKELL